MTEQQIIREFFQDEETAISYVRNRFLGNFDKAPPPTSDRFIEEFPADFLQHLIGDLEDKTVFWNACFRLFREWRDPEKADQECAKGLGELTYMIRQINHHHADMFSEEKDRWQQALHPQSLAETLYNIEEKDLVYTQNLSLVHIWNLWPDVQWLNLYENILKSADTNNEAQYEIMLIVIQHLKWDATQTRKLFEWTLSRDNLPETFYNQYFFHRLCLCGNRMNDTDIEKQKTCQTKLVDDILKAQKQFFDSYDKQQIKTLGKLLFEASELFDLKSFNCLDERRRALLKREIEKLIQPPSDGETSMFKSGSDQGYMVTDYSRTASLPQPLAA